MITLTATQTTILILSVLACLAIGIIFFAINEIMDYAYKTKLLIGPCQLCASEYPAFESCMTERMTYRYIPLNISGLT